MTAPDEKPDGKPDETPDAAPDAAWIAEFYNPVRYFKNEAPVQIATDAVRMAAAGATLVYAIYHGGKDFALSMPDGVQRAYARACTVYRV